MRGKAVLWKALETTAASVTLVTEGPLDMRTGSPGDHSRMCALSGTLRDSEGKSTAGGGNKTTPRASCRPPLGRQPRPSSVYTVLPELALSSLPPVTQEEAGGSGYAEVRLCARLLGPQWSGGLGSVWPGGA